MLVWLITSALAKPPLTEADAVDAQWRAMQVLRVRPESYRVIKEPITFQEGPVTVTLNRGVMIPVFSGFHSRDKDGIRQARAEAFAQDSKAPPPLEEGDVEFVGFVFTAAEGTFEVAWQERADNLIFANHQVTHLNQDKADWAHVAHGEPWTGVVNEGFILSTDPQLAKDFVGPDDPEGTPEDIIVYGKLDYAAARVRARVLFHDRRQMMMDRGFHAGRGVAWDRVAEKLDLETRGQHHVIDLHIDRNVGSPMHPPGRQPNDVDWISLLQDWTGVLDSRRHSLLVALDRTHDETLIDWTITGVPFPPSDPSDPTSPPLPPARLVTDEAFIVVQAIPVTAQLRAEVLARLKLTAVGGDFQVVQLDIPRHATQHDWKLLSVTDAQGTSLISRAPLVEHSNDGLGAWSVASEMRDQSGIGNAPMQGKEGVLQDQSTTLVTGGLGEALIDVNHNKPHSRVTLSLPEPIRKGETLVVDVKWQDVWPYGDAAFVQQAAGAPSGSGDEDMALPRGLSRGMAVLNQNAAASGPQPVLPLPAGSPPDTGTKFQIQVVVPERTKLSAAASGELVKSWSQDGYAYTLSKQLDHAVPYPEVHVGAFVVHDEAAAAGMPTVRTRTFQKDIGKSLAAETRAQINFFQGFLPTYPWTEHEIALGPAGQNRLWWASGHGLTGAGITGVSGVFQGGKLTRQAGAHTTQHLMAHELAHQWFGQSLRPADRSDAWFCETFAEIFGVLYIQALHADVDKVYDFKRRKFETMLVMPTTRAPLVSNPSRPILFDYGPYLFQEMLRPRMGDQRYFGAIDLLARDFSDRAVTTEHIESWFEQAAEEDIGAFFDFWVYGGFIPKKVLLEWDWADGQLSATVTGDVPFGTFDVPVVVDGEAHWVDVVDGSGELVLDAPTEPERVELDPDHRILAVKRAIKRRSGPEEDASSP